MGSSVTGTRGTAAAYAPPAPRVPVHSARTFGRRQEYLKEKCWALIEGAAWPLMRPDSAAKKVVDEGTSTGAE
jgi:hypothetical protein